ncbi:bifunctional DNA primase/polymerase [Microbacterium sp. LMI12-1-1.1]
MPAHGKRPVPAGATGRNGTVTPEKIADWIQNGFRFMANHDTKEWATQPSDTANTALRAGKLEVRIDVDDYGQKMGAAQLAELEAKLGPLPATPSSTSRGGDSESRQHFFLLHEPIELVGKAAADIDIIQHGHRYSLVYPSTNPDAEGNPPYLWYDADGEVMDGPPHIDDLEYLPQAWVDYLRVDETARAHVSEQWDGEIPEAATATEERKLRAIVASLQALPDVWHEGAGWHDVTRNAACWLWRMARSNAYALTPDQGYQLMLDHTPLYPGWGIDKLESQWSSCEKSTEGQFEEPPLDDRPPLLPWNGFPTDRMFPSINGEHFATLWMAKPENTTPAGLWGRRQQLLVAMLSSGFTEQEAATVVWHSGAAAHPGFSFGGQVFVDRDSRIITDYDLWREVDKAQATVAQSTGEVVEAAPLDERPSLELEPTQLSFLDDAERQILASPDGVWWGSRFVEWARHTYGTKLNESYYRLNRWVILSTILGSKAMLAAPGGTPRRLTLYVMLVGPTTSGKSTAFSAVKNCLNAFFLLDDHPDIGGDHTPESLSKTLLSRDGLTSLFRVDEAHEVFATRWNREIGPYSGVKGMLTDLYDGEVAARFRATEQSSGQGAETFMTVHLMGTREGMVDVIGPKDWKSGLMPRFVWAIGVPIERTKESMLNRWVTEEAMAAQADDDERKAAGRKIFQQWAAEFQGMTDAVQAPNGQPFLLNMPAAVAARWAEFAWSLMKLAHQHPAHREQLEATFDRLAESVMRAAGLVALSRRRRRVEMSDLLIAIEQGEEWVGNVMLMVQETEESPRTRQVNAIERYLVEKGGTVAIAAIHRLPQFRDNQGHVKGLIEELVAQGRAQKDPATDTLRLKGLTTEGAIAA